MFSRVPAISFSRNLTRPLFIFRVLGPLAARMLKGPLPRLAFQPSQTLWVVLMRCSGLSEL